MRKKVAHGVMDAYDQSKVNHEVKSWLHGVLSRVPYAEPLRLAIGGQDVPDTDTGEEWAECCCQHELNGVAEAKYWLPVVTAMGRSFPAGVPDPLSYMACLCDVHQGHPKLISHYIQTKFPKAQ